MNLIVVELFKNRKFEGTTRSLSHPSVVVVPLPSTQSKYVVRLESRLPRPWVLRNPMSVSHYYIDLLVDPHVPNSATSIEQPAGSLEH